MPAMVVNHRHIAFGSKIVHEIEIPFLMLAHSVSKLENALGRALRFCYCDGKHQLVGTGLEFKLFHNCITYHI